MKKFRLFLIMILLLFSLNSNVFAQDEISVPILLYHNVTNNFDILDGQVHISQSRFEEHIQALLQNGYHIISLKDYHNSVKNGSSLPEKPVILTFDDGYLSNYTYAFPIIKKYQIPVTFFVISGLLGYNDTLYPHFTWEQAKEMERSGLVDIQSHSNLHYDATRIPPQRLILELRKSKYEIETRLQKNCDTLAFPYGSYDENQLKIALEAGFQIVLNASDHGSNKKSDGLYHLNRLFAKGFQSGEDLIRMLEENV